MHTHKWFLLSLGLFLLVIAFTLPGFSLANSISASSTGEVLETKTIATSTIIYLTNKDRELFGMALLIPNSTLEKAAQMKAEDMAKKGYFSHNSPECSTPEKINCKTPWYYFDKAGYDFNYAGENLAVDFTEAGQIENAWMNSPTHKANIVSKNYSEVGIGIAYGTYKGRPTTFVVQLFGTKALKTLALGTR